MSENQSCERSNFSKGDFVTINGQVGIVAMVGAELPADMDDHCAVFFGTFEHDRPEIWTIPTKYLSPGPTFVFKH